MVIGSDEKALKDYKIAREIAASIHSAHSLIDEQLQEKKQRRRQARQIQRQLGRQQPDSSDSDSFDSDPEAEDF